MNIFGLVFIRVIHFLPSCLEMWYLHIAKISVCEVQKFAETNDTGFDWKEIKFSLILSQLINLCGFLFRFGLFCLGFFPDTHYLKSVHCAAGKPDLNQMKVLMLL